MPQCLHVPSQNTSNPRSLIEASSFIFVRFANHPVHFRDALEHEDRSTRHIYADHDGDLPSFVHAPYAPEGSSNHPVGSKRYVIYSVDDKPGLTPAKKFYAAVFQLVLFEPITILPHQVPDKRSLHWVELYHRLDAGVSISSKALRATSPASKEGTIPRVYSTTENALRFVGWRRFVGSELDHGKVNQEEYLNGSRVGSYHVWNPPEERKTTEQVGGWRVLTDHLPTPAIVIHPPSLSLPHDAKHSRAEAKHTVSAPMLQARHIEDQYHEINGARHRHEALAPERQSVVLSDNGNTEQQIFNQPTYFRQASHGEVSNTRVIWKSARSDRTPGPHELHGKHIVAAPTTGPKQYVIYSVEHTANANSSMLFVKFYAAIFQLVEIREAHMHPHLGWVELPHRIELPPAHEGCWNVADGELHFEGWEQFVRLNLEHVHGHKDQTLHLDGTVVEGYTVSAHHTGSN